MNTLHWSSHVTPPPASRVTRSRRSPSSPKYCWWAASIGWLISPGCCFDKDDFYLCLIVVVALILETKDETLKKSLVQSLGDLEFAKLSCCFFLPPSMITNPPSQLCVGWFLQPFGISQSSISRQIPFGEYTYLHLRIWVNWKNSPTLISKSPIKPYTVPTIFPGWDMRLFISTFDAPTNSPLKLPPPYLLSTASFVVTTGPPGRWPQRGEANCSCTMLCLGNVSYTDTKG